MHYLAQLQIDESEITNAGLKQLVGLKLNRLSVRADRITDEGMINIAEIRTLENVQCGRNPLITDLGYAQLKKLPMLRSLDVQSNTITAKSASVIAQLKGLEDLNLEKTTITDAGLKEVSALSNLISIGLPKCENITSAGWKYLYKLSKLQRVELDNESSFQDKDLDFVHHCPALTTLTLDGTAVTDVGMEVIGKTGITNLHIEETKVTDHGLMTLAKDKNLKTLKVTEDLITEAGINEFRKLRPNVLSPEKKHLKVQF